MLYDLNTKDLLNALEHNSDMKKIKFSFKECNSNEGDAILFALEDLYNNNEYVTAIGRHIINHLQQYKHFFDPAELREGKGNIGYSVETTTSFKYHTENVGIIGLPGAILSTRSLFILVKEEAKDEVMEIIAKALGVEKLSLERLQREEDNMNDSVSRIMDMKLGEEVDWEVEREWEDGWG
ncbi:MAG: hypothetical protein ACI9S8_001256 [Chlamydiales bacterium]|jgi:hypothetical protein